MSSSCSCGGLGHQVAYQFLGQAFQGTCQGVRQGCARRILGYRLLGRRLLPGGAGSFVGVIEFREVEVGFDDFLDVWSDGSVLELEDRVPVASFTVG